MDAGSPTAYFQSRPSQSDDPPDTTYFSNPGPNSMEARDPVKENLAAYLELERPFNLAGADQVPIDAVTQSAPAWTPTYRRPRRDQARRIAAVREL